MPTTSGQSRQTDGRHRMRPNDLPMNTTTTTPQHARLSPIGQAWRFLAAMSPLIIFGVAYFAMALAPNYLFGDIDIRGLYDAELALFGVTMPDGTMLTPTEWMMAHTSTAADFMAGCFYLCWVPLPVFFALYLYLTGRRQLSFRYALAFLIVNLLGFTAYYVHPAAPPWYVMQHGFEPILGTKGCAAGLLRFDELVGIPVFQTIYGGNSNVFAAVPSMHAAYCPVACFYAMKAHERTWTVVLAVVSAGIWWAAIYSAHHYTIDVLLGIMTAILGLTLFESVLMRTGCWRKAFDRLAAALG